VWVVILTIVLMYSVWVNSWSTNSRLWALL
jgi:hypothetical protein